MDRPGQSKGKAANAPTSRRSASRHTSRRWAMSELSLVEHALCPLDSEKSLGGPLRHHASYFYSDKHCNRKKATAVVKAVDGLSANDEFYLWGILGLIFSQPEPSVNFYATRNFILRQLGMAVGGENYQTLHAALRRLAGVRYSNDKFFDPLRGEHRQVSFGFFSYSIPADPNSPRAWHIAIDPIFFGLVEPMRAHFWFDLETYRSLDVASRRLFLVLKKVFHRSSVSPRWDLTHLAVDVLGYSRIERKSLKQKISKRAGKLAALGIIDSSKGAIERHGKNLYVQFHRGDYFEKERRTPRVVPLEELPIYEQWVAIGVDAEGMQYLRRNFSMELLQQWADITLAARERHGAKFFERSMAAYYIDNVKAAKSEGRSAPDWWHEFKKQELYAVAPCGDEARETKAAGPSRRDYLKWLQGDGRKLYEETLRQLLEAVEVRGALTQADGATARRDADAILWKEFASRHGTSRPQGNSK